MERSYKNGFKPVKEVKLFLFSAFFITMCVVFAVKPTVYADSGASAYVVMEQSSRRILKSGNANARLPMASTTKIATAITALENADINDVVEIPAAAAGVEGSSIYLKAGEKLTLEELLYGLMLRSGNDAATAIALHVGGSLRGFAAMMNSTAQKAGAENTNFVNPHGLPAENHYTTACDLAAITAYAYDNAVFRKIAATKSIRFEEESGGIRVFENKNKMLSLYNGGNGVKTGFTKQAGRCLVSAAKRGGTQLICVVLNCPAMWEDSAALMDESFAEYRKIIIAQKGILPDFIYVDEYGKPLRAELKEDLFYPLKEGERADFDFVLTPCETVLPVKAGDVIGKLSVYCGNRLIFEKNVYSIDNADAVKNTGAQKRSVSVNGKTQ